MGQRRKIIGVMGSGVSTHADLARPVGRLIARAGCHLLTGGGWGVMAETARAFCEIQPREGLSIGVIRGADPVDAPAGAPRRYAPRAVNDFVELPIYTHLPYSGERGLDPLSRNHINVLTADVLIALPGGAGTYSEVKLRLEYGRPVILLLDGETIYNRTAAHFAQDPDHVGRVLIAESVDDAPALIDESLRLEGYAHEAFGERAAGPPRDHYLAAPFAFPNVADRNVLIVGLGGGCDVIAAYAVSRLLTGRGARQLIYANTKDHDRGELETISTYIKRVPLERRVLTARTHTHGTTRIDRSLPRGDDGCPYVFILPEDASGFGEFVHDIRGLGFEYIVAVDTGGGALAESAPGALPNRPQRMLAALEATGIPGVLVVAGPGSTGDTYYDNLEAAFGRLRMAGRYKGSFPLEPILPVLKECAAPLNPKRTPNIIVAAAEGRLDVKRDGALVIPRGIRPAIPASWLTHAFVFSLSAASAAHQPT